uniref:Uncharacterized protein n=1 Tax=Streptomyces sp. NBC_01401 TaxID=2903854 RepID=A0AAU3GKC4_9ACTN
MSKKQGRQNRGDRSGGHERSAPAETKEQTPTSTTPDALRAIGQTVSHKKERKFGHN